MEKLTAKYWNPFLETLPREKLEKIELKNFRKYVAYAKAHSALYGGKFEEIEPEDLRSREDIRRLPLTDKEDLRIAQEREEPSIYGDLLGVDLEEVSDRGEGAKGDRRWQHAPDGRLTPRERLIPEALRPGQHARHQRTSCIRHPLSAIRYRLSGRIADSRQRIAEYIT